MRRVKNTYQEKKDISLCRQQSLKIHFENLVNYLTTHKGNPMHILNPDLSFSSCSTCKMAPSPTTEKQLS